jgi:hypothetical protein
MKIILLPSAALILLGVLLSGGLLLLQGNAFVIGGEYVIHDGEAVNNNLNLIFAQVELERGGRVDGRIMSFSSAVDLNGEVANDILAIGSDINVEETAQLKEKPREVDTFPYVILLPELVRTGAALGN